MSKSKLSPKGARAGNSKVTPVDLDERVLRRVTRRQWHKLPKPIQKSLDRAIEMNVDACLEGLVTSETLRGLSEDDQRWVEVCLKACAEAGFAVAVLRYAKHLRASGEAKALLSARHIGIGKGHETQAKNAIAKQQAIRDKWAEMEAAGMRVTNDTVAAAVGCSRSTVIRAFKARPAARASR